MQRVTIIGLGLIGGSIGLGLKQWNEANRKSGEDGLDITGFDTDLEQQQYAQKIKAVDRTAWDLQRATREADIVVLCMPVAAMREAFTDLAPHLKHGAVVTDTGSTKTDVLAWSTELLPRTVSFVGGHPMAGKAQSIEGAEAGLFQGATWCVAPSVTATDDAIRNVLGMIAALGAEPYFVDPTEHDAYVAGISHLPFVLSAALVNTVSADPSWRDMKTLAASGFRDVSRLAAGSPAMHRDILLTNKDAVRRWLDSYIGQLSSLSDILDRDPDTARDDLTEFFTRARDTRAEWSTQTTREGELLQGTESELSTEGLGGQMSRMLLGGLARRRRLPGEKNDRVGARGRQNGKDRDR